MSGIINGAGSKSGLLGTTELPYESGAWTPSCVVGTPSNHKGRYVQVGKLVFCSFKMDNASSSSGSEQGVDGFPATPYSEAGASAGGGILTQSGKAVGTQTCYIENTANGAAYRHGSNADAHDDTSNGAAMSNVPVEGFVIFQST
tara:strand:- start:157 stop:591 length:435 start_codon:yes stop_codon:yes gene_type:complete